MFEKFYGTLSIENIEKVSKLILETLENKKYVFVCNYEYKNYKPETRVNQKLKNGNNKSPLSFWYGDKKNYAGFNFGDTYGVWGCSTSSKDGKYDPEFNNPYIVVTQNQVTITQRTPEGKMCYWQLTVQNEN